MPIGHTPVGVAVSPDGTKVVTKEASNYIVVYDPQGGFVTGGGWIDSPVGAYSSDPTLTSLSLGGIIGLIPPFNLFRF